MTKNTFKYYKNEDGDLKIEMTQNAARDVANYKAGFEACAITTIYDEHIRKLCTAEYIASTFLEDTSCYEAMKFVSGEGAIPGYEEFLNAVEAKIGDLLG